MTYISKKEKVFDLPAEQEDTSTMSLATSETRLKRFPSVSDRRAWTTEECQRYQHFYGLVNGSESNVSKSSSFKYIPFDVLLAILMAEKDAYIQELLDRQDEKSCCADKANVLYRAEGFEDSDDDRDALIRKDAEMVALKNKISGLESELEDYRDTLTKAMHKLENMDSIMSENKLLREKLKYSEETIKFLEDRKQELEKELQYLKGASESESDMDERRSVWAKKRAWDGGDCDEIVRLSSERDILLMQVEQLQKELERTKINAAEMDVLRKMSETTSSSLEEIAKENECYKKKLETMKCLEKHIEDLKKQAQTLTEKYKRESQKANDHLKQINMNARELQMLRDERDVLQKRVEELVTYENQFLSLQSKLHQVEIILEENEILNKKLIQLDKLELENEHLKMKIDQLQGAEMQAAEDKERVMELQCAVVDQEEEIKKMLRQIEELSQGYSDKNEIHRLRNEVEEKNGKLKQYERQVAEIPVLESEIEELRNKLQKCIDDFKTDKDLLKRLQEELEACRTRCHELEEMAPLYPGVVASQSKESLPDVEDVTPERVITFETKGENTPVIAMEDAESQSITIECLDKSTESEPQEQEHKIKKELLQLRERNENLRREVDDLRAKIAEIDINDYIEQTIDMKELLRIKEDRIRELEENIAELKEELEKLDEMDELKQKMDDLETEKTSLSEMNGQLKSEIETQRRSVSDLETSLERERKAKQFSLELVQAMEEKLSEERRRQQMEGDMAKLQSDFINARKEEINMDHLSEINFLKGCIRLSRKVINEMKAENSILREMNYYAENVERAALNGLVRKLRAKVKVLKSLSKPELQAEYESLQEKFKMVLRDTHTLIDEIDNLKVTLNSEKEAKEYLEKELVALQAEITGCITAGSKAMSEELAAKDAVIERLKADVAVVKEDLDNTVSEGKVLKEENQTLLANCNSLKSEQKDLKNQINELEAQISQQEELEKEIDRLSEQIERQRDIEREFQRLSVQMEDQKRLETEVTRLQSQIEEHKAKEEEFNRLSEELEEQNAIKEDNKKLLLKVEEQEWKITIKENQVDEYLKQIDELKEKVEKHEGELVGAEQRENELREKVSDISQTLLVKEEEVENLKNSAANLKTEIHKRDSEMEVLRSRLAEKTADAAGGEPQSDAEYLIQTYEQEAKSALEEKYALEEAMRKIENELDELKVKLSECKRMEDEMSALRSKRDSLLEKMAAFEAEIEHLKAKLTEFEDVKTELEQLREEKDGSVSDVTVDDLRRELAESKLEIQDLRLENENLQGELSKAENLLEISKKLHKSVSQIQLKSATAEFFTPPTLPSPRAEPDSETEAMIPVKVHELALVDLENRFVEKIRKLKEGHVKKIRKLSLQHEKDAAARNKTFHDSINTIKTSYETGIRKLVEKHKLSIAKLQELHEEEVEELNKNYEVQMDALEKQNNHLITDLRLESTDKCRQMSERHNRDLRDLEVKYEKLLQEKETLIQAVRMNSESNAAQSTGDLQEVHKQMMENLTEFYQKSILEMEEKHTKELNKAKKSNTKRMELMKNKYEDLLVEERKKYEEQLEEMLQKLKNGQHEPPTADSVSIKFVQKRIPTSNPRLEFLEVLQKIINEGLESLSFDELILVHGKTCFVPESLSDHEERGGGEINDGVGEGCKHRALMGAEREQLLKRIFTLEREIVIKQLETHEAIVNMEAAEKYRIQELKTALCTEQQKNSELKRQLSNQSKLHTDMKIEKYIMDRQVSLNETNVMEKVKELEREKSEKKRIEEELQKEKENVKNLTALMETEKERFKIQRKRDSDYVDSIRQRLEEALSNEQMMESQLEYEARFRAKLESELQSLQKSFNLITDLPFAPLSADSKAVKDLKNFDQCDTTKEEIHTRSKGRHKSLTKNVHNL